MFRGDHVDVDDVYIMKRKQSVMNVLIRLEGEGMVAGWGWKNTASNFFGVGRSSLRWRWPLWSMSIIMVV